MTFLRKLITLSGCAKLKRKADNEVLDNEACLGLEAVEAVEGLEVVLQKVPSEANLKVPNHGEGPY